MLKKIYEKSARSVLLSAECDSSPSVLSVIVPVYNEEARLGPTLGLLELVSRECAMEVIVVCDGCTDRSFQVASQWSGRFHLQVISYAENKGKGYAVRQGVLAAAGDVIAFMDADGSTPPSELLRLAGPIVRGDADVVIGSRRAAGAIVEKQPFCRHWLGKLFAIVSGRILSLPFKDTQCGFKLFNRTSALTLFEGMTSNGFEFDLDILYRALKNRMTVFEVGVRWCDCAGSKVSPVQDGLRMLWATLQIRCCGRWGQDLGRWLVPQPVEER